MNSKEKLTLCFLEEKEKYGKRKDGYKESRPDKMILRFDFPTEKKNVD